MRINKWHVAGLFVALAIVSAIVVACQPRPVTPEAPTPTPTLVPPYLSILPDQVTPGSVLAIIGADWQPGEEVTIGLVPTVPSPNVGTAILAIATANVQGRFEFTATLPATIVPGVWEVYAQTRTAGRWASDSLIVLQPTVVPPTVTAEVTLESTTSPLQPTRVVTRQPQATATPRPPQPTPLPTVQPTFPDWRGDYFANASLAGFPSVIRNDPVLNFDWGYGSPDPRLAPDFFSVRWSRNMFFEAGTYRFIFRVDDGMRMYVDNVLVLDAWSDGPPRDVSTDLTLGRGDHNFRIEYYERTGLAVLQFSLFRLPPGTPSPFPSSTPTQPPPPTWTPPPPLPTNTPIPIPTSIPPTMIPPLPTNTPIVIPTAIPLPTTAPLPTATSTSIVLPTATSTATNVPPTATNTAIPINTATATVTPTATSTLTPTATATNAPAVATSTSTSTAIPLPATSTATSTPTTPAATSTSTSTPTSTSTNTPAASTSTATATATPTTPAATSTSTSTPTSTSTDTPATATSTATATPTLEPTATSTPTTEPTATHTPTIEPTATETAEPTETATPTTEPTATETSEPTATHTPTTEPETATPTPTTPAATVTPTLQITVTAVITGDVNLRVTGTGFTAGERLIISLADNPQGDDAVALNEATPYLVPRNGRLNFRTVLEEPPAGEVYAVVTNVDGEVLKIVPVRIRQ